MADCQIVTWTWVGGRVPRTDRRLVLLMPRGNSIDGSYACQDVWRDEEGKQVQTPLAWRYRCEKATV